MIMPLRIQVLILLILARLSTSRFVFELEVDLHSVTANVGCDSLGYRDCQTYFSVFCLREGRKDSQSTSDKDCPLGINTDRMNAYLENQPNFDTRIIESQSPWPAAFQLYIKARDADPTVSADDDLEDIIINRELEVNAGYTDMELFRGIDNKVSFQARFRVTCQQDYYGTHCSTHCVAQNTDVNGHYTCNIDGSIQCLEGFENASNNCRDRIDPCSSSPCANNSSCIPMGPFDYTCPQCAAGYTGSRCEVNIDDCQSAVCPNNSMCVDGMNSYECVCHSGFKVDKERCVKMITQVENQGTHIPVTSNFTTEAASENKTMPNMTMILYYSVAAAGAVALIVIAIVIFTVVLAVIVIKWKRKRIHCSHQEGEQLDNLSLKIHTEDNQAYGQFSSLIKFNVEDNPAYGQFTHHMKHPQER